MLSLLLFTFRSIIMIFPEVLSNIKYYFFSTRTLFKYKRACKKLLPTTMLASSVNYTGSVTDVYLEFISDIKGQINILHLKECLILDIC